MEKLFSMSVVLGASAAAVWLITRVQLNAEANTIVSEEIQEMPHREHETAEEEAEDADLLSTYWAGSIPEDCEEILDMLRFPEVYASYGSKMPRGYAFKLLRDSYGKQFGTVLRITSTENGELHLSLLLYGEPGTGKTYFGKMLADLANAHFFYAYVLQLGWELMQFRASTKRLVKLKRMVFSDLYFVVSVVHTMFQFCRAASQMDEIYVGSGPKKIRALFEKAKKAAADGKNAATSSSSGQPKGLFSMFTKTEDSEIGDVDSMQVNRGGSHKKLNSGARTKSIIFLDELDSLGVRDEFRHADARHATLSQLLACMDGIIESDDVFVVAATNYLDGIDSALTRSGRFDRMIKMDLPKRDSRLAILQFYLKKKPGGKQLIQSPFLGLLADLTAGFNSADVSTTVNEATLRATRDTVAYLKKRRLKASTNPSEAPAEDPQTALTEEHLMEAFWSLHSKISRERPRPDLLRKQQIDEAIRQFKNRGLALLSVHNPPQD